MKHIFKKSIILLLLFQLCAITANSQRFRTVSGESRNQLLNKITSVSSRMNTMECHFEQTQKMQALSQVVKSEGYMQYQKPGCMRWQYTAPTNYCFIVNNGKTVMKQGGKTIRNQGTKVFAGISKMVLSGISGNGLIDEKKFNLTYQTGGNILRIIMIPKSAGMRRVMNSIVMDFDIENSFIHSIEMTRKSDVTTITFYGKKINCAIAASQFRL